MSIADELGKLQQLRVDGVLTDEEFELQKRLLLDRGVSIPNAKTQHAHDWNAVPLTNKWWFQVLLMLVLIPLGLLFLLFFKSYYKKKDGSVARRSIVTKWIFGLGVALLWIYVAAMMTAEPTYVPRYVFEETAQGRAFSSDEIGSSTSGSSSEPEYRENSDSDETADAVFPRTAGQGLFNRSSVIDFLNSFEGMWQDGDGYASIVLDRKERQLWIMIRAVDTSRNDGSNFTGTACFSATVDEGARLMNEDRVLLDASAAITMELYGNIVSQENGEGRLLVGDAAKNPDEVRFMYSFNEAPLAEFYYFRDLTNSEAATVVSDCLNVFP